MPHGWKRLAQRTRLAIGLALPLLLAGCPGWLRNQPSDAALSNLHADDASTRAAGDHKTDANGTSSASGTRAVLASGTWTRTPESMHADARPSSRRWQHLALEDLLSQPDPPRAELHIAVADRNPIVATNAAIALARLGDPTVADRLTESVRTASLKLPIRCAAIEALGERDHPPRTDRLRQLLDQYGRLPPQNTHYVADLHAELLHALDRHADPSDQPRFVAALRSPSAEVRRQAIQPVGRLVDGDLPPELSDLRTDPDARVRAVCLHVLAQHQVPHVEEYLAGALNDCELRVRVAAVEALGTLPTSSARATLRSLLDDPSELIRAAATSSLASSGDKQALVAAASDKAWRVRQTAAKCLAAHPGADVVPVMRKLCDDSSVTVQLQAIQSLADWPLEQAGPILMDAMATNVYTKRKAAAAVLTERWPPAREFSADAPPERRIAVLNQLRQTFRQQIGSIDPRWLVAADTARTTISEDTLNRAALLLQPLSDPTASNTARDRAATDLKALGANLVDVLEKIAIDRHTAIPETIYHDILPQYDPSFVLLDKLHGNEVVQRRRAAADLADVAAKHTLRPLAMARLAELATIETDQLVWQSVLAAVANDGSEPAVRLAALAIGHPVPEVRRRACEYLAAHADPAHAPLLVPALDDPSEEVVMAAARALGACGRRQDIPPLERKLATRNEFVQLEAALALARLGDESGIAALERLSNSGNENVRRGVAAAIAEVPRASFVPILIRFLDDRQGVRVAALDALPKVVGQDVTGKPGEPPPHLAEHVAQWKRWYQDRK